MAKKTTEKKTAEKKTAEKKLLTMDMSIDEGQKLVDSGDVTVAQFTEWVLAKAKLQEKNGAAGKGKGKGRSGCEVTRADFMKHAKAIDIVIDGVKHVANVKHFQASEGNFGSFGWFVSGKGQVKLANGEEVTVQLSINLPVVNSKFQKD